MTGARIIAVLLCWASAVAQSSLPEAFSAAPLVRLGRYALWHDPGVIETLDFRYGIGGPNLAP